MNNICEVLARTIKVASVVNNRYKHSYIGTTKLVRIVLYNI